MPHLWGNMLSIPQSREATGEQQMSAAQIARRDFSAQTLRALQKRGIEVIGVQAIPGTGEMPWANADRGYVVNDNGCAKVWTFAQVRAAA